MPKTLSCEIAASIIPKSTATVSAAPVRVSNTRIAGFDGLRGVAVLLVWFEHRTSLSGSGVGDVGVQIFFVLSGFLIVDILRRARRRLELGESTYWQEWTLFFRRRARRIFPVYYVALAIIIPIAMMSGDRSLTPTAIAMHLTYLVNFWILHFAHHWNSYTTHLWSLSVEEQFYLLFPIAALVVPSRMFPWLCATVVACSLVTLYAFSANTFAPQIASLVAFGAISAGGFFSTTISRGRSANGQRSALSLVTYAALLALPELAARTSGGFGSLPIWSAGIMLAGILLASIYRNQSSTFVGLLECSPLKSLGSISYAFYVFHYPLCIENVDRLLGTHLMTSLPVLPRLAADFALPLAAAVLSKRYIEQRFSGEDTKSNHVETSSQITERNVRVGTSG